MKNNIVELKDLTFRWNKGRQDTLIIDELDIQYGEKIFIQGSSGSGKTTLLNLLGAVMAPTTGQLKILDKDINQLKGVQKDQFRVDHIGFIFQQYNLIPYLSMLENVALPCHFSKFRSQKIHNHIVEAKRLLSKLGLDDTSLYDYPVNELSVGQQQRVACARALIGKPEIIIADEPTSALDASNREAFIQLLFNECKESDSTLIFVSHDESLAHQFDRSIYLSDINRA